MSATVLDPRGTSPGYLSQQNQKPKPDYTHLDATRYFDAIKKGLVDKTQSYWFQY